MARSSTTFGNGAKPGPGRPKGGLLPKNILRAIGTPEFDYRAELARRLVALTPEVSKESKKARSLESARRLAVLARVEEMSADRLYGRPAQAITGAGGGPLVVSFQQLIGKADGAKAEKI